jgi:peptide/nickel transport system ATP-binding protein
MSAVDNPILTIDGLSVKLPKGADRSHALGGVSMAIAANEIVCVVGESGSGKSVMANAIMRLLPGEVAIDGGRVLFEGKDLASASAMPRCARCAAPASR